MTLYQPEEFPNLLSKALRQGHWSIAEALVTQGASLHPPELIDQVKLWQDANMWWPTGTLDKKCPGWHWLHTHGAVLSPALGEALLLNSMSQGPTGRLDWLLTHGTTLPKAGSFRAAALADAAVKRSSVRGMLWLAEQELSVDPVHEGRRPSLYQAVDTHFHRALDYVDTLSQLGARRPPDLAQADSPIRLLAAKFLALCERIGTQSPPALSTDLDALVPLWQALERLGDDPHAPGPKGEPTAWQMMTATTATTDPLPQRIRAALLAAERAAQATMTPPPHPLGRRRVRA
jgi:hypothetical protein